MLKYWFSAWKLASQRIDYDVVHAHDFDTLPLGYMLANDRPSPLVYDAHESYVDMIGNGRFPGWVKNVITVTENYFLKRVTVLITVGYTLLNELKRRGARDAALIGNWKELSEFDVDQGELGSLREKLGLEGKTVISYLGSLDRVRNVPPLVNAVSTRQNFVLIAAGSGDTAEAVAEAARRFPNIVFLGEIPSDKIPLYTGLADIVYYGIAPDYPNAKYSAPNKLYEAMAAGKALLVTRVGEVGPTVEKENAGVVLDGEEPLEEQIAQALDKLANPQLLIELQKNSALAGQQRYNWQAGAKTLIDIYNHI